jgi:hypothetical protein
LDHTEGTFDWRADLQNLPAGRLAELLASVVVGGTSNLDDPPSARCGRHPRHRRCTEDQRPVDTDIARVPPKYTLITANRNQYKINGPERHGRRHATIEEMRRQDLNLRPPRPYCEVRLPIASPASCRGRGRSRSRRPCASPATWSFSLPALIGRCFKRTLIPELIL